MRLLHLFACLCLLSIVGLVGVAADESDQVPSDVGATAAESSRNTAERPATAKPVVQRSRREICDTLVESAQSNNLPIPFFIRLLRQESDFKPDVVSRAGAQGIAQFMPETAATVGLDNPFDPVQAIAASARLLRDLVRQFGNLGLAAAAYNAGPRRIQNWLSKKGRLPDETQHYVKTITGRPAETWKAAKASGPAHNLPQQVPCREDAGVIASNSSAPQAAARPRGMSHSRSKVATRVTKRAGGSKGAIQLAAARKKGPRTVRLSQR
jgi:Transglycosylase SLT domain